MTQPNPELWGKFIEAVAKGQIEGLKIRNDHGTDFFHGPVSVIGTFFEGSKTFQFWPGTVDHLCAELRRWMEGKGYSVLLSCGGYLNIGYWYDAVDPVDGQTRQYVEPHNFSDGVELDWHLAAALWVLERGGGGEPPQSVPALLSRSRCRRRCWPGDRKGVLGMVRA